VVLAELITGKKPGVDLWVRTPDNCFDINPDELRAKSLNGCPPRLLDLCVECCQYEPLLRPKFDDVLSTLISLDQGIPNPQDSQPQTSPRDDFSNNRSISLNSRSNQNSAPNSNAASSPSSMNSTWKMAAKSFKIRPNNNNKAMHPPYQPAAVNMHLMKMVERATTDYYYDISYIHDLLLSYRCFTTPSNLFDLLVQRHSAQAPDGLPPTEAETWLKSQRVIQLRVLIFLKRWIDSYHTDFNEAGMEERLVAFDKTIPPGHSAVASDRSPSISGSDDNIKLIILLQRKRNPPPPPISPNLPPYPQAWFPPGNVESLELVDVQPQEMARQISLIQSTLYAAIRPREYLQYCAERAGEKGSCWVNGDASELMAPNLHALATWSGNLARMVSSEIVKHSDRSRRVIVLDRFIEVAEKCLTLKNFDAVFNIMEGIRHPSIERLAETFRLLSPSAQRTLDSLKQQVSKEGDFKHYREAMNESTPPTLPHFDGVLEEMWFLECSSPKVLNGGIVNFFHYRQIARKVFSYQQCLPSPFLFRPVPPVQKLLTKSFDELLDDEQLKRKSLLREEPAYF